MLSANLYILTGNIIHGKLELANAHTHVQYVQYERELGLRTQLFVLCGIDFYLSLEFSVSS